MPDSSASRHVRDPCITGLVITSLIILAVESPLKDVPNHLLSLMLFGSVIGHRVNKVFAQVFVRAIWWIIALTFGVTFLLDMGLSWSSSRIPFELRWSQLRWGAIASGPLGALILAGRSRLIQDSSWFNPRANRLPLTISMILGCADAILLLLLGAIGLTHHGASLPQGIAALAGMVATLVMIFGLYRMRVWGAFGMLAVNIIVAALGFMGAFIGYPEVVGGLFLLTTIAQTVLATRLARLIRANNATSHDASNAEVVSEEKFKFEFESNSSEQVTSQHVHSAAKR